MRKYSTHYVQANSKSQAIREGLIANGFSHISHGREGVPATAERQSIQGSSLPKYDPSYASVSEGVPKASHRKRRPPALHTTRAPAGLLNLQDACKCDSPNITHCKDIVQTSAPSQQIDIKEDKAACGHDPCEPADLYESHVQRLSTASCKTPRTRSNGMPSCGMPS